MGGVDLFDQQLSLYRIRTRCRKGYHPLFSWIINALMVNSWRFYQDVKNPEISLLQFTREVVISALTRHGEERKRSGRRAKVSQLQNSTLRYDGMNHWPIDTTIKGGVCPMCSGRSKIKCKKCNVALHIYCFENYHRNPDL